MIGSPSFYGSDRYQKHDDIHLEALKTMGIDTLFLNIAWSRPWLDSVNLEDIAVSSTYPAFSADDYPARRQEFITRLDAAKRHHMKTMGLFGIPRYLDFSLYPERYRELMGSTQSTISELQNICVSHSSTLKLYSELVENLLTDAGALDGMLVYTFDELAEVCAVDSDCPRCRGISLEQRIPVFLNALFDNLQKIKPGFELWWEPWELSESQVYAVCEKLNPAITISVHSTINEVYFVNTPDIFVRNLARLCRRQNRKLILELFMSGSGEDLGPIASYPCPGLVLDQLSGAAELDGCTGIKEYYGFCIEYFAVNEAAVQEFITSQIDDTRQIIETLANRYASQREDAKRLRQMWDYAESALLRMPWDISWVMRFSNLLPYDPAHWGAVNFRSAMCTPWETPSWLSSRRSYYYLVENSNLYNQALYDDVRLRLSSAISAAGQAIELGKALSVKKAFAQQLDRQIAALELFVICATSRANYQQLSYLAEKLRTEEKRDSHIQDINALLESEIDNAGKLVRYLESDRAISTLLPDIASLKTCIEKIQKLQANPAAAANYWITTK